MPVDPVTKPVPLIHPSLPLRTHRQTYCNVFLEYMLRFNCIALSSTRHAAMTQRGVSLTIWEYLGAGFPVGQVTK
jgi:hypothetical protein